MTYLEYDIVYNTILQFSAVQYSIKSELDFTIPNIYIHLATLSKSTFYKTDFCLPPERVDDCQGAVSRIQHLLICHNITLHCAVQ